MIDLVHVQYEKACKLLSENKMKLHELAKFLYEKETITGDEFMEILFRQESLPFYGSAASQTDDSSQQEDSNIIDAE